MPTTTQNHDQRFKELLHNFFQEFFQLFFPAWVDRFVWEQLVWLEQEIFVDVPQGESQIVDLIASLPVTEAVRLNPQSPEHTLIHVHVEVEQADSVASFRPRMSGYYHRLRFKHQIPVLPIALYLRVGLDGIGWDTYAETLWEHTLHTFVYPYVGLPALDGPKFLESENLLGVALSVMMKIPEDQKPIHKLNALKKIVTSPINDAKRFLLCECVEAYLPLEGPHLAEYYQQLATKKYKEVIMVGQTTFEKGIEKGLEQGLLKGREEGRERSPEIAGFENPSQTVPQSN